MHARKRKNYLPTKIHIVLLSDALKKTKKQHKIIHTFATPNIDLKYYVRFYKTIHCQFGTSNTINVMNDPMVVTVLTQYHFSKGLKLFGQSGLTNFLKEMNQMHYQMVMDTNNPYEVYRKEKAAALQ